MKKYINSLFIVVLTAAQLHYATAVTGIESNYGKNLGTHAMGSGQFYPPAKREVETRLGRHLNLSNRDDSLLAIVAYADINKERLAPLKMAESDLYAAHMLGAGTYKRLRLAPNGTSLSELVPASTYNNKVNYKIFHTSEGLRTPHQVLTVLKNKYNYAANQ